MLETSLSSTNRSNFTATVSLMSSSLCGKSFRVPFVPPCLLVLSLNLDGSVLYDQITCHARFTKSRYRMIPSFTTSRSGTVSLCIRRSCSQKERLHNEFHSSLEVPRNGGCITFAWGRLFSSAVTHVGFAGEGDRLTVGV